MKLSIIFIVCSNKIKNHVMLNGEGNENGEKTTIGLINKKKQQLCTSSTLLFLHFFALVLYDHVKLPETS